MKKIKDTMNDDNYERYEPILIVIVDIIKQIATVDIHGYEESKQMAINERKRLEVLYGYLGD